MALYDRLIGVGVANRIPIHAFQAVAAEWARGKITGAEANTIIEAVSGAPLDAGEQTDAAAVVALIADIAVTGTAVQQVDARARRAMVAHEIDQVLLLAGLPGYSDETELRAKLGT